MQVSDFQAVATSTIKEGRFTGTICQSWSEGLCSLVPMYAGLSRNSVCVAPNRIGGAH
jgi:hypothetical protein